MSLFTRTPFERTSSDPRIPSPGIILAAARAMWRTMINRRAAHHVADLPDYLLTDIGLKRDDVHEALNRDWREDATFRLAVAAAKRRRAQ